MKKLFVIVALLAGLSLAVSPASMAQGKVDIDAVSEAVMAADLDSLLTALKTPPADDQLPDGFTDATFADPAIATGDIRVVRPSDLEGSRAAIAYVMEWNPASGNATAEATASPVTPESSIHLASLNYVFFETRVESEDLDRLLFGPGGRPSGSASMIGEALSTEDIRINGTDAVLVTYVLQEQGIQSAVQLMALPVGDCVVIAMLVEAGSEVDPDTVQSAAEDLVLSGTSYLGTIASSDQ